MSGGSLFDYSYPNLECADGRWCDEELNELYRDLFIGGEFSVRGYGGLCQSLDFYLSSDIGEDSYREKLMRFKAKWFGRTPRNRVAYYERKIQECADRCKAELGLIEWKEEAE